MQMQILNEEFQHVHKYNPIEHIKSRVKTSTSIVNKLKSIFNFSWSLPHIKLPHFSISGSFSLNPPSIPHISVDWYRKAMNNGMILNSPTIFGMKDGSLLGGGEVGSETVVGTDSLMNMITSAVSGIGDDIVSALLSAGKNQPRGDVNINVEVNGAENPEEWGRRLVKQMKLEMRTV